MPIPPPVDARQLEYRSMVTAPTPLGKSNFTMDTSGLVSILGGPAAKSSLALVHIYKARKWLGWYNSPGSYYLVELLSGIAPSNPVLGLIAASGGGRGKPVEPEVLFGYDGQKGPRFRAPYSGTIIDETGHLAALFTKECEVAKAKEIKGRETRPVSVTIARLHDPPKVKQHLPEAGNRASIWALVPIIASLGTCIVSALYSDWYAFSIILFGIMVNGLSCLVVGLGELTFIRPDTSTGSPRGDGILGSDKDIILLVGAEQAVSSITRGKFLLDFNRLPFHCNLLGLCSILLLLQSLMQILLVPQCSLFGQLMFVSSIAVSWSYNAWLSSLDKYGIQRRMLLDLLSKPKLTKYKFGTRTTMVVFVLLVLNEGRRNVSERILNDFLPNNTEVWRSWKKTILDQLDNGREQNKFNIFECDRTQIPESEIALLQSLFQDAQTAFEGYKQYQKDMKSHR